MNVNGLREHQEYALTHPATDPAEVVTSCPHWQTALPGGNMLAVILAVDR